MRIKPLNHLERLKQIIDRLDIVEDERLKVAIEKLTVTKDEVLLIKVPKDVPDLTVRRVGDLFGTYFGNRFMIFKDEIKFTIAKRKEV